MMLCNAPRKQYKQQKISVLKPKFYCALAAGRSLLFYCCLWLWTILWGGCASPLVLISKRVRRNFAHIWSYGAIKSLKYICGVNYEIIGVENIPQDEPFIIASKHQSTWDTFFFLYYFLDAIFILKQELTRIPIYVWHLKSCGMIIINRKEGIKALKSLYAGIDIILQNKKILVIFPEGTRVVPGQKTQCKPGIFAIHAAHRNVKIIPVSLNSGLIWKKGSFVKQAGTIMVEFCKPMPNDLNKSEFLRCLGERIDSGIS